MIKTRAPTFLGHEAQFHCRKETAHTWPGFRRADVQQQRFSNRRINLHTVSHCCWPHGRSLPGVCVELGHGNLTPNGSAW